MDIFDVLNEIVKRKIGMIQKGMNEKDAINDAMHLISNEYHIPLGDIRRIYSY